MKKLMLVSLIGIASLAAAPASMAASIQPNFSYQGQLLNDDGTPANGMFDIHLSIYEVPEGGVALWEETQTGVQVDNGLFNVVVGAGDPLTPDLFANSNDEGDYVMRYLEIQVGGDPPLMPRPQLLAVPYSVASSRMAGDIFTSPGSIRMGVEPGPLHPSVELQALPDLTSFTIFNPGATNNDKTVSRMTADMSGLFDWNLYLPDTGDPRPVMDMNTGPGGEISWMMFNPQPEPPGMGVLGMNTNSNGADFAMTSPQFGGLLDDISPPMIKLSTLGEVSTFQMLDPTAGPDGGAISEMTANVGGEFSWKMFNPQPEPPGRPIMAMSTGPGGEISWVMFNPQPEPPGEPWMDFGTDADGPHFRMAVPAAGGGRLDITDPMVDISANSSGSEIKLQRNFVGPTGAQDSARIYLAVDPDSSVFDMRGPNSVDIPAVRMINYSSGPMVGIGADPTNILTVRQFSATDPIADAWTTYSSRRWKKNIKTIHSALEKVEQLRGVTFDWKADGRHDIGLIAEEVGEVIPEVVAYEENGVDAKSVDYARLVSVLIQAVKEQQKTISGLQQQVTDLSHKYQQLTDRQGEDSRD